MSPFDQQAYADLGAFEENAMGRDTSFVDVEREIIYWRMHFGSGAFPGASFGLDIQPIIKIACDIYTRDPHGSREAWLDDLVRRLNMRSRDMSNETAAREFASRCWDHLLH
ncbi:hypothetical protein JY404_01955 [Stenotrophomonas maltophilia]|nr:hypothetical protein [Stenotrophomonas maltophilia]MBA0483239.1 hypothetical protein [Stenotrophomonas maltophilia]MBA0491680.1 hypothetical protein [Stenotrophomonas maltophilia]MBA0492960.1 hypothetical protein [Stenotrophomonas maltophilia]MBN4973202.1 hypothetical protein [Stenotrophomonas maltophilia]